MKLTLIPVTAENRAAAERLEGFPFQRDFVESVAQCMSEADELADWQPMCLMDGEALVGFAMYGLIRCETPSRVWFDRLLIDRHFQGRGYGRAAVAAVIDRLHREFPGEDLFLSVYEDNAKAIGLYESFGFRRNGELDFHGEKVMVLPARIS